MQIDILAMLQTAIATAVILGIGMVGLYAWLRSTGRLKSQEEKIDELYEQAARNQGFESMKDFVESYERDGKTFRNKTGN